MSVAKVYFWLTLHYHQHVTAEDLAFLAKMSYSDLKSQFVKMYSIDVWDYLRELRLNNAKYLLANTPYSVREVARKVGYSSECLEKYFHDAYHMTPLQYRKELKWEQSQIFDDLNFP